MTISNKFTIRVLLGIKALIWIALAAIYWWQQISPNPNLTFQVVGVLLLVNGLIYLGLTIWWRNPNRLLYWVTVIFLLFNIVLTITDNIGWIDIVSLLTDIAILLFIVFSRPKSTSTNYV